MLGQGFKFYKKDLVDVGNVEVRIKENFIVSIIHFSALKVVDRSMENLLDYYYCNNLVLYSSESRSRWFRTPECAWFG